MKKSLSILFFLLIVFVAFAQEAEYSRARIFFENISGGLGKLAETGVDIDHGLIKTGVYIESDFSKSEIQTAKDNGYTVEIIISDVTKHYIEQNFVTPDRDNRSAACGNNGKAYPTPQNFSLGSMGGYFTYSEMMNILDEMYVKYPNLITSKKSIGKSLEERDIWMVKISDNPEVDEDEPEVFYNSLHHSREPASLSQLIFYMWYLLENYDSDTEVKYLVDNTAMFFVPCVNPDGYVWNETNFPDGGGMWRKNRRDNGDGSFGVDLNRNYGKEWGYDNSGSSPNPGSEVHRGTGPFSEPETQVMKAFCESRNFKVALNYHTFGNLLIYPWGYIPSFYTPDSALFVNYAMLLTKENHYKFGTANQTVNYSVNGNSDDWMYGETSTKNKIIAMTPEAGEGADGFWPAIFKIERICSENVYPNLSLAHLVLKHAIVEDISENFIQASSGNLPFNVKCLGMDAPSTFTVSIIPLENIASVGNPVIIENMQVLDEVASSIPYTLNSTINVGDVFTYILKISNGSFEINDTIRKTYGTPPVVFADDGNSLENWSTNTWGISNSIYYSPSSSITDSPFGNYPNNANRIITLDNTIDLKNATSAYLTFMAQWDIEANYDFVQVMASTNGSTFVPLCGKYTKPGTSSQDEGMPVYDGKQLEWVEEIINLQDFLGQEISLRFRLISDIWTNADGFYFDDLKVMVTKSEGSNITDYQSINFLGQNQPNPAGSYTYISFDLPVNSGAELKIFDNYGKLVFNDRITGDSKNYHLNTEIFSSGIYYYTIVSEQLSFPTKKMIVVRN
jgi:carboxypeptidase T